MPTAVANDHPGDRAHRIAIRDALVAYRRPTAATRSCRIGRYEDFQVVSLQRYAAAVGRAVVLDPGIGDPDAPTVAMWRSLANATDDPDLIHAYARNAYAAQLVDAQDTAGMPSVALADLLGINQSATSQLRAGRRNPMVSTWQRWARALGGQLTIHLEVAG